MLVLAYGLWLQEEDATIVDAVRTLAISGDFGQHSDSISLQTEILSRGRVSTSLPYIYTSSPSDRVEGGGSSTFCIQTCILRTTSQLQQVAYVLLELCGDPMVPCAPSRTIDRKPPLFVFLSPPRMPLTFPSIVTYPQRVAAAIKISLSISMVPVTPDRGTGHSVSVDSL